MIREGTGLCGGPASGSPSEFPARPRFRIPHSSSLRVSSRRPSISSRCRAFRPIFIGRRHRLGYIGAVMKRTLPQRSVDRQLPRPVRLPSCGASRLEDASFWLLGIATLCSVVLFLTSIARFAGRADQFVVRLQAPRQVPQATGLAGSTLETNRSAALRVLLAPAPESPGALPAPAQPASTSSTARSDI